jgi:hypothetical protein
MENDLNLTNTVLSASSSNFVWVNSDTVAKQETKIKRNWFGFKKKVVTETLLTVDEFFEKAKFNKKQVEIIEGITDKFLKQIERAEQLGQVAMVEKMKDEIEVVKKEAIAGAYGCKEYLEEEQIKELIKKAVKGISITPIKNFTKFIPDEVSEKMKKFKENNVFDDYVIVHYDPEKKAQQMTKEEKAKDPILFGKINGSTNYYFIGDWIDEWCNLTLKSAVKIISDKSKKLV